MTGPSVENPTEAPPPDPSDDAELLTAVSAIVDKTTLQDVRLTEWSGTVDTDVEPESIQVRINVELPQYRVDEGRLVCRFRHQVELLEEGKDETYANVRTEHLATFLVDNGVKFDEQAIGVWVDENVYFIVYPYLRETVQTMTSRLGLEPIVLGIIRRGTRRPSGVTVLTRT